MHVKTRIQYNPIHQIRRRHGALITGCDGHRGHQLETVGCSCLYELIETCMKAATLVIHMTVKI